jgi:hypothetical protein
VSRRAPAPEACARRREAWSRRTVSFHREAATFARFSKYMNEALQRYGDKTEVLFASHHWPVWKDGNDAVSRFLRQQPVLPRARATRSPVRSGWRAGPAQQRQLRQAYVTGRQHGVSERRPDDTRSARVRATASGESSFSRDFTSSSVSNGAGFASVSTRFYTMIMLAPRLPESSQRRVRTRSPGPGR